MQVFKTSFMVVLFFSTWCLELQLYFGILVQGMSCSAADTHNLPPHSSSRLECCTLGVASCSQIVLFFFVNVRPH